MAVSCGIILTSGDPRTAAELAALAEEQGWDGVFTWDGVALGSMDTYDPWVLLAAMAMRTERVRLGAIVTPPSRRRPWKLARETMTLDRLSNGRLVLPVGLGALDDGAFARSASRPRPGSGRSCSTRPWRSWAACGAASRSPSPAPITGSRR